MDLHDLTMFPNLNKFRSPRLFHHFEKVRIVSWHSSSKAIIFSHKKCKMSLIIRQVTLNFLNQSMFIAPTRSFQKIFNQLDVHNQISWNEIGFVKVF